MHLDKNLNYPTLTVIAHTQHRICRSIIWFQVIAAICLLPIAVVASLGWSGKGDFLDCGHALVRTNWEIENKKKLFVFMPLKLIWGRGGTVKI